jgi:pimeloyl-ACP methyl ester carboxylesterase
VFIRLFYQQFMRRMRRFTDSSSRSPNSAVTLDALSIASVYSARVQTWIFTMKRLCLMCVLTAAWSAAAVSKEADAPALQLSAYTFEARGTKVEAERGDFWVPENRANPKSRKIKLSFVRFASTNPNKGAPIIYLAGGPGGSGVGTARGPRFPIFMALREVADVIAFDQRGTGWSNDIPVCQTDKQHPLDRPLIRENVVALLREAAEHCAKFWRDGGIDISGYNTEESAADVEDLRKALGASQIKLWGISYGSHLALAVLKRYSAHIERVVLAGLEGLDETVKLPALTDEFFARVQSVIDADPKAAAAYPDLAGLMRRVHAKLDKEPVTVTVKDKDGRDVKLVIGKFDVQLLTATTISDPSAIARVPAMYAKMDAGSFDQVGAVLYQFIRGSGIRFSGMTEAMDIASGISVQRARLVERQARTSLLADALNYPMPHMTAMMVPDLGEGFRSPVKTDVPTLFISGTLDGRTYPQSSAQIAAGFKNATRVVVENGGHNIFEAAPEIGAMVLAFMKGQATPSTLKLPPPQFLQ